FARALTDTLDDLARLLGGQIHFLHLAAAPGIGEMINAQTLHVMFEAEIENGVQCVAVERVECEAHSSFHIARAAAVYGRQSTLEGALQAAQLVVAAANAVHADADVF